MTQTIIVDLAVEILQEKRRPLHYKELTDLIMKKKKIAGRTPQNTIRAAIAYDTRFKRVGEGVYALAVWDEYPVARFAKDIAYDILKKRRKPISPAELGRRVLEERQFVGSPASIAQFIVRSDPRVYFDKQVGVIGLREWQR